MEHITTQWCLTIHSLETENYVFIMKKRLIFWSLLIFRIHIIVMDNIVLWMVIWVICNQWDYLLKFNELGNTIPVAQWSALV